MFYPLRDATRNKILLKLYLALFLRKNACNKGASALLKHATTVLQKKGEGCIGLSLKGLILSK
jgi:hypothetical protein